MPDFTLNSAFSRNFLWLSGSSTNRFHLHNSLCKVSFESLTTSYILIHNRYLWQRTHSQLQLQTPCLDREFHTFCLPSYNYKIANATPKQANRAMISRIMLLSRHSNYADFSHKTIGLSRHNTTLDQVAKAHHSSHLATQYSRKAEAIPIQDTSKTRLSEV